MRLIDNLGREHEEGSGSEDKERRYSVACGPQGESEQETCALSQFSIFILFLFYFFEGGKGKNYNMLFTSDPGKLALILKPNVWGWNGGEQGCFQVRNVYRVLYCTIKTI